MHRSTYKNAVTPIELPISTNFTPTNHRPHYPLPKYAAKVRQSLETIILDSCCSIVIFCSNYCNRWIKSFVTNWNGKYAERATLCRFRTQFVFTTSTWFWNSVNHPAWSILRKTEHSICNLIRLQTNPIVPFKLGQYQCPYYSALFLSYVPHFLGIQPCDLSEHIFLRASNIFDKSDKINFVLFFANC